MSTQPLTIVPLPIASLQIDPKNRIIIEDQDLHDLAADIKRRGVLIPPLVRSVCDGYMLIDGHRRRAAALLAGGIDKVHCAVFGADVTEEEIREAQLALPLHNKALSPWEVYIGATNLLALRPGATGRDVAASIKRSESYLSMALSAKNLIQPLKALAEAGKLHLMDWPRLAKLPDSEQQAWYDALAKRNGNCHDEKPAVNRINCCVGKKATISISGESLSLSTAIEICQEFVREAKKAAEQGISAASFVKICKDKAKAS